MKHETIIIHKITNCARCGRNHIHVKATKFLRPIGDATFWATCPSTGDPILIVVFDDHSQHEEHK